MIFTTRQHDAWCIPEWRIGEFNTQFAIWRLFLTYRILQNRVGRWPSIWKCPLIILGFICGVPTRKPHSWRSFHFSASLCAFCSSSVPSFSCLPDSSPSPFHPISSARLRRRLSLRASEIEPWLLDCRVTHLYISLTLHSFSDTSMRSEDQPITFIFLSVGVFFSAISSFSFGFSRLPSFSSFSPFVMQVAVAWNIFIIKRFSARYFRTFSYCSMINHLSYFALPSTHLDLHFLILLFHFGLHSSLVCFTFLCILCAFCRLFRFLLKFDKSL